MTSQPGPPATPPAPSQPTAPQAAAPQTPLGPSASIPRTRTSATWWTLALAGLALLVVLIFILQNQRTVSASFFTAEWRIPLGVDLLLAALLGALVVFLVGAARMLQLRFLVRRAARAQRGRQDAR